MKSPHSLPRFEVPDNLTDTAYKAIKEYILGAMFEDENLPITEAALASQMGISKTPIREALKRLEGEGFLKIIPHKGAYIIKLTPNDIAEIFQVREYLEALAVRLVTSKADDKMLQDLSDMVKMIALTVERGSKKEYETLDIEFHTRLVELSGNDRLMKIYVGLRDQIRAIIIRTMTLPGRPMKAQKWHEEIVEAILRRDADLAESLIREHIRNAGEEILRQYNSASAVHRADN